MESRNRTELLDEAPPCGNGPLLLGVMAGPVVWALHLQICYALVPWVCKTGRENVLHGVSAACLLLIIINGIYCALALRRLNSVPRRDLPAIARNRLLAAVGLMNSGLFGLIVVAQAIASFILSPCAT